MLREGEGVAHHSAQWEFQAECTRGNVTRRCEMRGVSSGNVNFIINHYSHFGLRQFIFSLICHRIDQRFDLDNGYVGETSIMGVKRNRARYNGEQMSLLHRSYQN